ncbi:hypothetical protein ACEPAF_232 [Sanghuangporus sanghuang]
MNAGCGPLVGILRTNAIGVSFPESRVCAEYCVLCLNISYVNHSCVPNSIYSLDKSTMIFSLRAIRDIAPGEEISITYLGNDETSTVRKAELQNKYGFICSCILCSAPTDAIVASDERRKFIKATNSFIKHMWQGWLKIAPEARRAQATQNAETVEKLLQAMDKENIHIGRMDVMQKCVYMYAVLCDVKNFKKWARRCLKVAREKEHSDVKDWEGWLKDPTSFPLWDLWKIEVANFMRQSSVRC